MADKDKGKYVPIFLEWLEVTQDLTAEEKGNLIDAVVSYAAGQEYEQYLSGGCRIAFRFLKGQVDRNKEISEKRSVARRNKTEQTITNDNKPEQTESNLPKEKEKDKEKEKEYSSVLSLFPQERREALKNKGSPIRAPTAPAPRQCPHSPERSPRRASPQGAEPVPKPRQ